MNLRESFDTAAKIYDEARPSYPEEVIDWIISRTGISSAERLLEIGAGTGQATVKFAERGYGIRCIEMGGNMAERLVQNCRGYDVTVDVDTFETWKPEASYHTSFIFSATAFHWLDPLVKYRKCHELLRDNGYLVLLWNVAPESENPIINEAFDLLWKYYPEKRKQTPMAEIKKDRKKEIADSGLFTLEDYLDYRWNPIRTRESVIKAFCSQSSYLSLDAEKQKTISGKVKELFMGLDDTIHPDLYTTVYIARKK